MPKETYPDRSLLTRILFRVPVLGRMLREVYYGDSDNIYYFLFSILALWFLAVLAWGYPALIVPMMLVVPAMFVVLVMLTVGQ
ncbi:hypothetical protein SLH49_11980 [Cognatiyoonia sp. IB215446]|uniref:hypothetical protein n=1 Tax=Cognatiyoonia sp. IB215446 TaxID=3097355 RepID=UPI002A0BDAB4|nr:hypothetical protein [Cognatiyoonia sp. IB215446]MDX8348699.1 hypothetical protein [Cognatiyoonia sp. IB215446]